MTLTNIISIFAIRKDLYNNMYNKYTKTASLLKVGLLIYAIIICFSTCNKNSTEISRSKEQYLLLQQVSDSVLSMASDAIKICDSIMKSSTDSFTFYDYYILKGRHYILSAHPDSALIFASKTKIFANSHPLSPRTQGLSALANNTEASFYHLLRQNPVKVILLYKTAYEQIMNSDIIDYSPEISANLADAYLAVDNLPNAAKWYRRALYLVDSLNLPSTKVTTCK